MSGFEIAGVVLGAFPVAVAVVRAFGDVAKKVGYFKNIQVEYNKCLKELEFQMLAFTWHLENLLLPLLVDDDEKIRLLVAHPGGPDWREPSIALILERRLGASYGLYINYMAEMSETLERLKQELAWDLSEVQTSLKFSVRQLILPHIFTFSSPPFADTLSSQ